MKVNWPILIVGLMLAGGLVAILASGFGNDPKAVPSVLVGQAAPSMVLTTLDGDRVDTRALKGPMVVNFWSTWCGPCKDEHDLLQASARSATDVSFYGVLYGDEPEKARRYLQTAGAAYPTLIDENNRAAIDFGVSGVPETFFVDRRGTVIYKHAGAVTPPLMRDLLQRMRAP